MDGEDNLHDEAFESDERAKLYEKAVQFHQPTAVSVTAPQPRPDAKL
jgi:hypothetical protein